MNKKSSIATSRFLNIAMVLLAFVYFLLNIGNSGPAYLQDEVGYLTKASFLAGFYVDGASSYHGGWSILLAPLFLLDSEPGNIFRGIVILNTFMFLGSALLIRKIIFHIFPLIGFNVKAYGVLLAMLYPSWLTMIGYAFPSILISFLVLINIWLLLSEKIFTIKIIVLLSVISTFIYWVHPTGIVVSAANFISLLWLLYRQQAGVRAYLYLALFLFSSVISLSAYSNFHSYMNHSMTPVGLSIGSHYRDLSKIVSSYYSLNQWIRLVLRILGGFYGVIVATFGLALFPLYALFIYRNKRSIIFLNVEIKLILIFIYFSLLFVLILSGQGGSYGRVDHWIYGRYLDPFIPILISIGFVGLYSLRSISVNAWIISFIVLMVFVGLVFNYFVNLNGFNNLMNTPSFWPQYFIREPNYFYWFALAGAVIMIVILKPVRFLLPLCVLTLVVSYLSQSKWRAVILADHSSPSSFVDFLYENVAPGSCVGFDLQDDLLGVDKYTKKAERFKLYSFYLYKYNYRRVDVKNFEDDCAGVMLTYHPNKFLYGEERKAKYFVVGRELDTGLFLIVPKQDKLNYISNKNVYWSEHHSDLNVIAGGFVLNSDDLKKYTKVGLYDGTYLISNGVRGFLSYGPYFPVSSGSYNLEIRGSFINTNDSRIEVYDSVMNKIFYNNRLCVSDCLLSNKESHNFVLPQDVDKLEIRIWVDGDDKIKLQQVSLKVR